MDKTHHTPAHSMRILVVAATARELATSDRWTALVCGVGPVEAAIATASAINRARPSVLLHVGIAGARRARALAPASLVIGCAARYCDLSYANSWAPRSVTAPAEMIAAVQRVLPTAPVLTIGTSAQIGGSNNCDVEAMEGFSVLRAAQRADVPAIEVRAISNDIEESDRARWHFDAAFAAIRSVTPSLVAELARCLDLGHFDRVLRDDA